jgi:electron transport complex protein RnfD
MDAPIPHLDVAPSPHVSAARLSTARMMREVMIGLLPVTGFAVYRFGPEVLLRLLLAMGLCVGFEAVFMGLRGRAMAVKDGSAALTGLIFALTLPPTAPLHVIGIGSLASIGLGKAVFGGLGQNMFNPAMVGRAFVTAAFPASMSAAAFVPDGMSGATPLTLARAGQSLPLGELIGGVCWGSMGEVSAVACLLGGVYLIWRGAMGWQIPFAVIGTSLLFAVFRHGIDPASSWSWAHELTAGGLFFGAFYIATDPVSSPVSHVGRLIFGAGIAILTWFFRSFSGYPEGFMFAVLLMNAVSPLINQLYVTRPVGGHA